MSYVKFPNLKAAQRRTQSYAMNIKLNIKQKKVTIPLEVLDHVSCCLSKSFPFATGFLSPRILLNPKPKAQRAKPTLLAVSREEVMDQPPYNPSLMLRCIPY